MISRSPAVNSIESIAARHGDVQVMPTSFAQQRFWVLDQLVDDRSAYTLPVALRINGALNREALLASFNAVIARHEALRTLFALDGDAPTQVVITSLVIDMPVTDLRDTPPDVREARVSALASENANSAFDLSAGPLLRASLLQLAADEHVLLVAIHHMVADGWSLGVLFDEIGQHYQAALTGSPTSLAALPLQYPDFAVWQRKVMGGNTATRQLAFWREQLGGVEPLELPIDHVRPATFSARGDKCELEIPASVVEGMRALARRELATPSMAFLAAFFALLHRYSGQNDFAVATITSGRLRPEVEPLIGLFVNTLALRASVNADDSFTSLLKGVAASSVLAQSNQNVPFEHVVDALKVSHDQSRPPVVQVCFQLLEGLGNEPSLGGLTVSRVPSIKRTSKFELTLMLHPAANGGLRAVMEYATDLFDLSTAQHMLAHYASLLAGIVRDASARVGRLPLLPDAERQRLLTEWNNTSAPLPAWTVPSRVLSQAAATPHDIAVRAGARALSYRELAQQSASLANLLVSVGIKPGDRVAVCVDRTPDLIVALLATLRIGAAYVPVDAEYPSDRIAYVLGDAGAAAVITDATSFSSLPWTNLPVVRVDETRAGTSDDVFACATIDAESAAYVLYTSGSTGRP
ncbi:MAG: AMP-binding protein, partial [Phycisphaerae bacterium]|nr:AMP-binding protein [Gemmatimonadaceae bacterium]